jgi:hypothetical protein
MFDDLSGDRAFEAVVAPSQVGPRVMDLVGVSLLCRTAGGEIPVSQGAQGLAQAFRCRIEMVIDEHPVLHGKLPLEPRDEMA